MKIRGNTVGTPLKPEAALLNCTGLTEEQKAQVRENIGAAESALFVTTDNVHASHNSGEIITALQNGRHVILELASGVYAANVSTDQEFAYFDQLVDNTITRYTIDPHGNVSFANLFGDIETALDAIIAMQEELIGS